MLPSICIKIPTAIRIPKSPDIGMQFRRLSSVLTNGADTGLLLPAFRDEMAGMLDLSIGSNRPNGATRDLAINDCYAAVAAACFCKLNFRSLPHSSQS